MFLGSQNLDLLPEPSLVPSGAIGGLSGRYFDGMVPGGLDIFCGCFGAHSGKTSYPWLVVRDLGLLAAAFVLAVEAYKRQNRVAASQP